MAITSSFWDAPNPPRIGPVGWEHSRASASEESVAAAFVSSREYQARHPSPKAFVDQLYIDLLGRTADSGGESNWVNSLPHWARPEWPRPSRTAPNRSTTWWRLLLLLPRRAAGPAELQSWTSKLGTGAFTFRDVLAGIVASDEYFQGS